MIHIALAFAMCCIGAWFGFANQIQHQPFLVLFLPAGLALLGMGAKSIGKAFRHGLIAGALAYAGAMYWVAFPIHDYGNLPWVLAVPCPILLGLYCGLYAGFFSACLHWGEKRLPALIAGLFAICLWSGLEAVRGWLFTGFPWIPLASAFAPYPFMIQGAVLFGAYGLSGLLAGAASLLILGRGKLVPSAVALSLVALLAGFGTYALSLNPKTTGTARVALVQGNINQAHKWDSEYQEGTVDRYRELTLSAIKAMSPELAIWPETAMPFYFQETSLLSSRVRTLARNNHMYILSGAPGYTPRPNAQGYDIHNRAFLVGKDGGSAGIYDKQHLVPFGEYVPFGRYLPFLDKLVQGAGDFTPGSKNAPLNAGPMKLGVLICYETIFPELAQARVSAGANVLVNISNDAWFGNSSAPYQHLDISILRAVEQGRWILRGTNTGISAIIDAHGRIQKQGSLFRAETVNFSDVQLISELTPYHQVRTTLQIACAVALLFMLLGGWLAGPRKKQSTHVLD
ncbi:apolipoprotein N-acyltransferase [Desulfobaculum bizertense]|uniref:Apolipoprotein N-acyltransferase n=1 Tax=Desulfobaculum bizertense DSM 18034 TaxID=1121442 RepID=A0A1T4W3V0_9BACT|nr:apolipoprotein N-acyltransferase [Desulfobaculum bizertense]SKA71819.1 apolipoprotein N-acyltransferase [Desulfobaculum bizertense DSM 18034]